MRLQRLTSSRLTHQISAHSVFLSLLPRLASASHFTISQRFLDITQNIHFNVASHHATHTYIDNGQIVARMDKSVIPEEEVTGITSNNSEQPDFPTTVSEIEQQQ